MATKNTYCDFIMSLNVRDDPTFVAQLSFDRRRPVLLGHHMTKVHLSAFIYYETRFIRVAIFKLLIGYSLK